MNIGNIVEAPSAHDLDSNYDEEYTLQDHRRAKSLDELFDELFGYGEESTLDDSTQSLDSSAQSSDMDEFSEFKDVDEYVEYTDAATFDDDFLTQDISGTTPAKMKFDTGADRTAGPVIANPDATKVLLSPFAANGPPIEAREGTITMLVPLKGDSKTKSFKRVSHHDAVEPTNATLTNGMIYSGLPSFRDGAFGAKTLFMMFSNAIDPTKNFQCLRSLEGNFATTDLDNAIKGKFHDFDMDKDCNIMVQIPDNSQDDIHNYEGIFFGAISSDAPSPADRLVTQWFWKDGTWTSVKPSIRPTPGNKVKFTDAYHLPSDHPFAIILSSLIDGMTHKRDTSKITTTYRS
mgnify:CR=1 FL=1